MKIYIHFKSEEFTTTSLLKYMFERKGTSRASRQESLPEVQRKTLSLLLVKVTH